MSPIRHEIIDCSFCGEAVDLTAGGHLYKLAGGYACIRCSLDSEDHPDHSDYDSNDLRAGEPSRG